MNKYKIIPYNINMDNMRSYHVGSEVNLNNMICPYKIMKIFVQSEDNKYKVKS